MYSDHIFKALRQFLVRRRRASFAEEQRLRVGSHFPPSSHPSALKAAQSEREDHPLCRSRLPPPAPSIWRGRGAKNKQPSLPSLPIHSPVRQAALTGVSPRKARDATGTAISQETTPSFAFLAIMGHNGSRPRGFPLPLFLQLNLEKTIFCLACTLVFRTLRIALIEKVPGSLALTETMSSHHRKGHGERAELVESGAFNYSGGVSRDFVSGR